MDDLHGPSRIGRLGGGALPSRLELLRPGIGAARQGHAGLVRIQAKLGAVLGPAVETQGAVLPERELGPVVIVTEGRAHCCAYLGLAVQAAQIFGCRQIQARVAVCRGFRIGWRPGGNTFISIPGASGLAAEFVEIGGQQVIAPGLVDVAMERHRSRLLVRMQIPGDALIGVALCAVSQLAEVRGPEMIARGLVVILVERRRACRPSGPDIALRRFHGVAVPSQPQGIRPHGQAMIAAFRFGADVTDQRQRISLDHRRVRPRCGERRHRAMSPPGAAPVVLGELAAGRHHGGHAVAARSVGQGHARPGQPMGQPHRRAPVGLSRRLAALPLGCPALGQAVVAGRHFRRRRACPVGRHAFAAAQITQRAVGPERQGLVPFVLAAAGRQAAVATSGQAHHAVPVGQVNLGPSFADFRARVRGIGRDAFVTIPVLAVGAVQFFPVRGHQVIAAGFVEVAVQRQQSRPLGRLDITQHPVEPIPVRGEPQFMEIGRVHMVAVLRRDIAVERHQIGRRPGRMNAAHDDVGQESILAPAQFIQAQHQAMISSLGFGVNVAHQQLRVRRPHRRVHARQDIGGNLLTCGPELPAGLTLGGAFRENGLDLVAGAVVGQPQAFSALPMNQLEAGRRVRARRLLADPPDIPLLARRVIAGIGPHVGRVAALAADAQAQILGIVAQGAVGPEGEPHVAIISAET